MAVEEAKFDAIRTLADFEAKSAVESRSKLIDEHHSAFRWIIASLFALNGGAIFAIFGRGNFGLDPIFLAFWFFFAGIMSVFLSVIFSQISDRLMISQVHRWGLYWTTVSATGTRDVENESDIRQGIQRAESWGRKARLFALFAMAWFVIGVLGTIILKQRAEIARIQVAVDHVDGQLREFESHVTTLDKAHPSQ